MRGDALVQNQRLLTQAVMAIANDLTNAVALQLTPIAAAKLPVPPQLGMVACVTDHNGGLAWGSVIVGGGAAKVLGWYNGTNWTVIGT